MNSSVEIQLSSSNNNNNNNDNINSCNNNNNKITNKRKLNNNSNNDSNNNSDSYENNKEDNFENYNTKVTSTSLKRASQNAASDVSKAIMKLIIEKYKTKSGDYRQSEELIYFIQMLYEESVTVKYNNYLLL